jgi:exodeoxyribonuclease V alpha subunit
VANGDTGVVIRDQGRLVAVFHTGLGMRTFELVQLEGVETAYAMTIHKSQGSEYPTVVLVLPPANSPLVGRELVYTGATRAKNTLHVVGSVASLQASLTTPAHRMTGLADALRSP